jgi:tetratricopeptide (TPR) repeat protein
MQTSFQVLTIYPCFHRIFLFLAAMSLILIASVGYGQENLFSIDGVISDTDARLALARLLSYKNETLEQAQAEYHSVIVEAPERLDIRIELADICIRLKQYDKAAAELNRILACSPDHPNATVKLAQIEIEQGHAKACRRLFQKALTINPTDSSILSAYAEAMNMWGDFYRIEAIYRNHLNHHPNDNDTQLKLAGLLVSAQQYESAEGLYVSLRHRGYSKPDISLALAKLHAEKKDFSSALTEIEKLLNSISAIQADPAGPSNTAGDHVAKALTLKADIFYRQRRYAEAVSVFTDLTRFPDFAATGWTGLGKCHRQLAQSDSSHQESARCAFDQAMALAPDSPIVQYEQSEKNVLDNSFVDPLMTIATASPMKGVAWAGLYSENGHPEIAIRLFRNILNADPECYPAQLGLAENLAFNGQYSESLELFQSLSKDFPGNSKIWISWARVQSWNKDYDTAIETYDAIHAQNQNDPLPVRESARVAVWGKRIDQAMLRYRSLLIPRLDICLARALKSLTAGNPAMEPLWEYVQDQADNGSVYTGYEYVTGQISELRSPADIEALEGLTIEWLPVYRIQKWAVLESSAKWLAWNKRFVPAMDAYESLLAFEPGNQEALFDAAQVKCALGLCDQEAEAYETLLALDPTHVMSKRALERQRIRQNPIGGIQARIWDEAGWGELAQMSRRQIDVFADLPIRGRYHLRAELNHWLESPKSEAPSQDAYGHTLEARGVITPWLEGRLRWTHKIYTNDDFGQTDTGLAAIRLNVWDGLRVGLGFERSDELTNAFGLRQAIQADHWKMDITSFLTRKLEAGAKAEYLNYSDDNTGQMVSAFVGYAFTDHPRIFKTILTQTYRNTANNDTFIYDNNNLVNIIHPYWTPKDLWESAVTLEWYHDLSRELYCGAPLHYYDIRASVGTDTQNNDMIRLEADWHKELSDHWAFVLKAMGHRSREWNADGLWGELQYQF